MNRGRFGLPTRKQTYQVYDPFCPPAFPSHLSDEFAADGSGVPDGWVSVGVQTPTITRRLGKLEYITVAAGGTSASAIQRGLPAGGVFTVATHITQWAVAALSVGGLFVRNTSTGRIMSANTFLNSGNLGDNYVSWEKLTAFNSRNSVGFYQTFRQEHFYRITADGTTIKVQFSYDGIGWLTLLSETLSTWFGGGAPDAWGLCLRAESGNQPRVAFDFARCFATADADIGRLITREV